MTEIEPGKQLKGLNTLAMVNVGIWICAMVALIILMQKGGNIKGMFVIFAAGLGVGIQIIAMLSRLKKQ